MKCWGEQLDLRHQELNYKHYNLKAGNYLRRLHLYFEGTRLESRPIHPLFTSTYFVITLSTPKYMHVQPLINSPCTVLRLWLLQFTFVIWAVKYMCESFGERIFTQNLSGILTESWLTEWYELFCPPGGTIVQWTCVGSWTGYVGQRIVFT
jgi:hypothetical protein